MTESKDNARPLREFDTCGWRMGNAIAGVLARTGIGPIHLLTTRGRRTGRLHANPVVCVEQGGKNWLVAPTGPCRGCTTRAPPSESTCAAGAKRVTMPSVRLDLPKPDPSSSAT